MKIDVFCHILPRSYATALEAVDASNAANIRARIAGVPALIDLDLRKRQLEEFGDDYRQVISLPAPAPEELGPPEVSRRLARIGNEGLAELVAENPDRFAGFVAAVPLNDVEAAISEIDHACGELGAVGVQTYTHVNGRPFDEPEFEPFFAKMAEIGRMIWVHPNRDASWADYPTETRSRYEMWWVFGWPYDTAVYQARLVFGGILERHPDLKVLIHHGGSMVPHFSGRVGPGLDQMGARTPPDRAEEVAHYPLTERPLDYFKRFYVDTALFGAQHALRCSLEFYGVERALFASDSPFDPEKGPGYIRATIANIEGLGLSDSDLEAIYEGNARRIIGLE
ncbi:MAG TPA: amidohydrolase family protein [Solirubrobacteraceae bacterium]|nr:amidohydrolase family protein [Solirubrobacteraceae bacterium]